MRYDDDGYLDMTQFDDEELTATEIATVDAALAAYPRADAAQLLKRIASRRDRSGDTKKTAPDQQQRRELGRPAVVAPEGSQPSQSSPTPLSDPPKLGLTYAADDAHDHWHGFAAEHGVSVSAILEALTPDLNLDAALTHDQLQERLNTVVRSARKIDQQRRRRRR
ncbi:MAG: hypothetical protein AAGA65_30395 [Actinomycetota bacterium]